MTEGTSTDTRGIEKHSLIWQGVEVEISFERNWLGMPPSDYHPCHIEVRAIRPDRAELPITDTGLEHRIALRSERLRTIALRDPDVADEHGCKITRKEPGQGAS